MAKRKKRSGHTRLLGKKIKVEPTEPIVEVKQDLKGASIRENQDTWTTFQTPWVC